MGKDPREMTLEEIHAIPDGVERFIALLSKICNGDPERMFKTIRRVVIEADGLPYWRRLERGARKIVAERALARQMMSTDFQP